MAEPRMITLLSADHATGQKSPKRKITGKRPLLEAHEEVELYERDIMLAEAQV